MRTLQTLCSTVLAYGITTFVPLPSFGQGFVNFESGATRPLALSPDGTRLFATNTPDNRLEVLDITPGGLVRVASVTVGLEPVAVAARSTTEVWVVNHLSDSISIIDLAAAPPRVVRTLLTCDEPRDIVFAGPGNSRAFVTTARRGQNCPLPANLTTQGIGRAVVQVYDAAALAGDNGLAGTPLTNLVLFGDTPRALARSADGGTVYAAIFQSGNQTTALGAGVICNGGAAAPPCGPSLRRPGGLPAPNANIENIFGPEVGLIVRRNPASGLWEDELARNWSEEVDFDLPDQDVFQIDANAPIPVAVGDVRHVGTVLFNMATNPVSGKLYVSNTEARNEVRFEGPGLAFGSTTVQGRQHEARITVVDSGIASPRHLNKHIDYSQRPAPTGVKEHSLATPVGMAVSADGTTLYLAAFGSNALGVFSTAALEADTFTPDASAHIALTGGGPLAVVLDESRDQLYTLTRFDNAVSVVRLSTRTEIGHLPLYSPEPAIVRDGRRFLYDAAFSSSNGEASCSSCHVFGDLDNLAWDLGNPDDVVLNNPLPFRIPPLGTTFEDFHPLKGPMTTQSLRGMANQGSMHWRGDRTGGNDPGGNAFDEVAGFKKFNPAFPGLLGRDSELSDADMQAFTDFILTVTYPPNPVRALDGVLTPQQQAGHDLFFGRITDTLFNCNGCHTVDPPAGFFGGDGFATFEGESQMFKVAHLRNVYQKVGMFRRPNQGGPQVRGFGILHDGSVDTVFRFLGAGVFTLDNPERRNLEQFVLAADSNLAPIVGQQTTLTNTNAPSVGPRLDLLLQRANLGECDLIVKGTISSQPRGAYLTPGGLFQLDRTADAPLSDVALRAIATTPSQELTYTCVPPGSGERIGVDRDGDGFFDRDELDHGSNPDSPDTALPTEIRTTRFALQDPSPRPRTFSFQSGAATGLPSGVEPPTAGGPSDPALHGATVIVYAPNGSTTPVTLPLPATGWRQTGGASRPRYEYRDATRTHGPVRWVQLKDGALRIRGNGTGLPDLSGAPHEAMALRLTLGSGQILCAAVPAKGPTSDTPRRFTGARRQAPPLCPPVR